MSDYSTFTRSTGSAIVLRSSLAYIGGEVVFDSNFAFTGGALNILDGSRVGGGVMLTVCVWSHIDGSRGGGGSLY